MSHLLDDALNRKIETYIGHRWQDTFPGVARSSELISSPYVYTTPNTLGTGLNHLFYWDTYFANVALIHTGEVARARANVDALIHLLNLTGFVPNINVPSGANRSQTPYLSHMIMDIYSTTRRSEYLRRREAALHNEYLFWMTERVGPNGLNRYGHNADDEYLLSFYDDVLVPRLGFSRDVGTEEKHTVSGHYLAEAEATCDFTSRFLGRAGDFLATDLNANLAKYERNFARIANELDRASEELYWERRYRRRVSLMEQLFWSEERGYYFDYDASNDAHSPAITAAAFSMLWNGTAPPERAARMREALRFLETDHGVLATDKQHLGRPFQWDYPFGWPPHQFIVVHGLLNYGYEEDAVRIARKYLSLLGSVFERTGHLWEKYDVVAGDLRDTEYPTETQLGWTAGVFADFTLLLNR